MGGIPRIRGGGEKKKHRQTRKLLFYGLAGKKSPKLIRSRRGFFLQNVAQAGSASKGENDNRSVPEGLRAVGRRKKDRKKKKKGRILAWCATCFSSRRLTNEGGWTCPPRSKEKEKGRNQENDWYPTLKILPMKTESRCRTQD